MGANKTQFMEVRELEAQEETPTKPVKLFKAGCSSIHKIMGEKGLGLTGEKYLREWYLKKKYHREKDFYSLYVEKGLQVEPLAIKLLGEHLRVETIKNDEWLENDFLTGIPDVMLPQLGYDTKCSWSLFTFPMLEKKMTNKEHEWQGHGYMALTGFQSWFFAYFLIDTPQPLIQQELKKLYYESGGRQEDWTPDSYADLAVNYKFDDIPLKDKIKIFEVKRDEKKIELIYERVKLSREYLKSLTG